MDEEDRKNTEIAMKNMNENQGDVANQSYELTVNDLKMIKVLGKGNYGEVALVRIRITFGYLADAGEVERNPRCRQDHGERIRRWHFVRRGRPDAQPSPSS